MLKDHPVMEDTEFVADNSYRYLDRYFDMQTIRNVRRYFWQAAVVFSDTGQIEKDSLQFQSWVMTSDDPLRY